MPRKAIVKGRPEDADPPKDAKAAESSDVKDVKIAVDVPAGEVERPKRQKRKTVKADTEIVDDEVKIVKPVVEEKEDSNEDEDAEEANGDEPKKKRRKRKKLLFSATKAAYRKKAKDEVEEEPDEPEPQRTPTPVEPEKLVFPMPTKEQLSQYTPFQLLLDYFLRLFNRLDPDEYFTFPVTDDDAPAYSEVILTPMNLMTMRIKLANNAYKNLQEFKTDAYLICDNAFKYNDKDTVHYLAARKFKDIIDQSMTLNSLAYIYKNQPFMKGVRMSDLSLPEDAFKVKTTDVCVSKELLDSVRTNKSCLMAYLKNDEDKRETTLHVLTPSQVMSETEAADKKTARVYDLIPRLKQGNPGFPPTQNKIDVAVPVTALDYGPYASFAPIYSAEYSTMSLHESIQMQRTYGSAANAEYASGLKAFVEGTHDSLIHQVDNLLDVITGGRHTRLCAETAGASGVDTTSSSTKDNIDFDSLRTLSDQGFDMSFLNNIEMSDIAPKSASYALRKNAYDLSQMQRLQTRRLSQQPPFTITHRDLVPVSRHEVDAARAVTANITSLITEHNARANADMDVLYEFLQTP